MRKLLPTLAAVLLIAPFIAGSAHAQYRLTGPRGAQPGGGGAAVGGGGPGGGGGFVGRPGGRGPGGGGPGGSGSGGFVGRPGGALVGGRTGGAWRGSPGYWGHDRWRGGFRGSVVFVDPWYDPFWPYGYGFGWGYGWYGPPRYTERVTEYVQPPLEDYGPPPEQYWYYCSNPDGYYPYVQSCNGEWQAVPVTPPGSPPTPQSRPSANSSQPEDRPGTGG